MIDFAVFGSTGNRVALGKEVSSTGESFGVKFEVEDRFSPQCGEEIGCLDTTGEAELGSKEIDGAFF